MKQVFENIAQNNAFGLIYRISQTAEELALQLDDIDIEEFEKVISNKRKLEYLGVRVAIKRLLGTEKKIRYNADGKPFLTDNSFKISVSHSGCWVAVIAHPTSEVGIDIEVPTEKIKKIYPRFLNDEEQKYLAVGENLNLLMLAWSGKEALYKIIGKDAVDFAQQLHISAFEISNNGIFKVEHVPTKQKYELQYIQNKDYTLVYCVH